MNTQMKTLKRFTLATSLTMAAWQTALPCADYDDPSMYNHFKCVAPIPSIENRNIDESTQFWARRLGIEPNDELRSAVDYLSEWMLDDEDTSNLLLQTIRERKDEDGMTFLRLNLKLNRLISGRNGWEYQKATPADYEALLRKIDAMKASGELANRKLFMKMRCFFALKDYEACLRLWDKFASKWEPSGLRNRMEGYVAGVYYRRKQYEKAVPMYFDLGDDGSIQLCVNRMLASSSIEQEYQRDPNSKLLPYILEDYANYYYHAKNNDWWEHGNENPIWTTVTDEAQKNIALAERVAGEGKTSDPQMWKAFAGFLQMTDKRYDAAFTTFEKAEHMKGNSLVKPCLHLYKFVAALNAERKPADFDAYVLDELKRQKWTDNTDAAERNVGYSLHEYEMVPALLKYLDTKHNPALTYVAETAMGLFGTQWKMNHEMTLDQVLAVEEYLKQKPTTPLEAYLVENSILTQTPGLLSEMIGTKLMRDNKYEMAIEYFETVPMEFIKIQGISPYLRERVMPKIGFGRENYSDPEYDSNLITQNKKLAFCHNILKLEDRMDNGDAHERAVTAIELAKLCYQASPMGDLWAMSEYSWSSYGPKRNELTDQALYWLRLALQLADDYNTMVESHFGLAAINQGEENEGLLQWSEGLSENVIATTGERLEAYQWLRDQRDRSHPVYEGCDWLKLYVVSAD